jgi:hypothetical protein
MQKLVEEKKTKKEDVDDEEFWSPATCTKFNYATTKVGSKEFENKFTRLENHLRYLSSSSLSKGRPLIKGKVDDFLSFLMSPACRDLPGSTLLTVDERFLLTKIDKNVNLDDKSEESGRQLPSYFDSRPNPVCGYSNKHSFDPECWCWESGNIDWGGCKTTFFCNLHHTSTTSHLERTIYLWKNIATF